MVIFPLAPDQTIAQMWSNGAWGEILHLSMSSHCYTSSTQRSNFRGTKARTPSFWRVEDGPSLWRGVAVFLTLNTVESMHLQIKSIWSLRCSTFVSHVSSASA